MRRTRLTDRFRALHVPDRRPMMRTRGIRGWAKVTAGPIAQALATTSAGHAFTAGLADGGQVTRDMALQHATDVCASVGPPVNGDFENGFGDDPRSGRIKAEPRPARVLGRKIASVLGGGEAEKGPAAAG